MGGSPQPKNSHDRKYSASFPISESDTLPLRRCPSVSPIRDNCPQTVISTGQRTQMWHALSIFRSWPLHPSFLLNSHGVVCFPFRHAGPHYLIGRHWLTANWIGCRYSSMIGPILEANLNQGCWRTGEHRSSGSRVWIEVLPMEVYPSLRSVLTSCFMRKGPSGLGPNTGKHQASVWKHAKEEFACSFH